VALGLPRSKALKILGICGSLRTASCNHGLLRAAAEQAEAKGVDFRIVGVGDLPLYNEDLDGHQAPKAVRLWKAAVAAADGVFIASPETNFGLSAPLKNALDWASRHPSNLWKGKAAAVASAGGATSGGARAQMQLRQVGVFLDLTFVNAPEVAIRRFEDKCFDEATGELRSDTWRGRVGELLERLLKLAAIMRKAHSETI